MSDRIDFEAVAAAALAQAERLIPEWFPAGKRRGRKFLVGSIRGEAGKSLSINLDKGLWKDFATETGGHDLIDLRAAMKHGGNRTTAHRVEAAKELRELLGLANGAGGRESADKTTKRAPPKKKTADDWRPGLPPPGTKRPDALLSRFDVFYEYTDATDRVTHYVGRIEARGPKRKSFGPITWGVLNGAVGWHQKAPGKPLPLYGLNRLATMPGAEVIVCEGEKSADAAQVLFPDRACVSWYGGTGRVEDADLGPLRGRRVIGWPDADDAGRKAMATLLRQLPGARAVDTSELPEGFDAADLIDDDPLAWVTSRLRPVEATGAGSDAEDAAELKAKLLAVLSVEAWIARDIPNDDCLLGELLTSTARVLIVGETGLGKTMFAMAMACAMATGGGFLHWPASRPLRVLIIDGEMPSRLIQMRCRDMLRRCGKPMPPGHLTIVASDMAEEFAKLFPSLGMMPPLNSPAGHDWIIALINALGGVDVVIGDNVMSLTTGIQKDEETWTALLVLIMSLSRRRIAQVWLDHTGHDTTRSYGTSTKSWRMDTVAVMEQLPETARAGDDVAFTLTFKKARRRTPENRPHFEDCTIRLQADIWTCDVASTVTRQRPLSPKGTEFHRALLDALVVSAIPGQTTREAWYAECARRGIADPLFAEDSHTQKEFKRKPFRKYLGELKEKGWIGVDGEVVNVLTEGAP